jgi:cystathionine beta-lyase/cystathionine gamma-synthase
MLVVPRQGQPDPGEKLDLIYSRFNHPNAEILEDQIVPLETNAKAAAVFNSGMAAIMTALFTVVKPGDTIIYTVPLYGGTQHFIHEMMEPLGIRGIAVDAGKSEALDHTIRNTPHLRVVFLETPANPTMLMTDIRRAAKTASEHPKRPLVMVDNTFFGPVFQHPLALGADLSLYSATKYLSGFSDMIAGVALSNDVDLIKKIRGKRGLFGNILQPDECWMLDGRLPTVALRMNKQSKSGQRIAERLAKHPKLKQVFYPTLFEDPEQKRIYKEQCDYPGALFSIEVKGGKTAAFDFLRNVKIARNAVSLGGVETLVCHPKTTTHSGLTPKEMDQAGITDGMVRVSIGIEDWRDLLADFEQALDVVKSSKT